MATFRLRASGKIIEIPDGFQNLGAAQSYLLQQGLSPEEVGVPREVPETSGPVENFDIGMGKFFADRIPGMANDIQPPAGLAASLGYAAPLMAASLAVPAAGLTGILSQGALGAGAEALRKGASAEDIALGGAFSAGGTAAGNLVSRVSSGILAAGQAAFTRQAVKQTDDVLRMAAEGTGGNRIIESINRKALGTQAAGAIYQKAARPTSEVLDAAATDIGALFDKATPTSYNPAQAKQLLDAIPASNFPGKSAIMELADKPDSYTALHRSLRELELKMSRSPTLSPWADEVAKAQTALEGSAQGIDQPLLTRAREGWKNLRILEGLRTVVDTGEVPVKSAAGAFSSETRGYGTSYKRGLTAGTQPETQQFIRTLKTMAANPGRASSQTAERLTATIVGGGILTGVATGKLSMEDAAKLTLVAGLISPSLAAATVGTAGRGAGIMGQALGSQQGQVPGEIIRSLTE